MFHLVSVDEKIDIFLIRIIFIFFVVLSKALFAAVDQNHNGTLDFTDMMALVTILNKFAGEFGTDGAKTH